MRFLVPSTFVVVVLLAAGLAGCTQKPQNAEDLKEQTARETAALKNNVKAMAQGVREGWNRDQSVDVNSASKEELVKAGLTSGEAEHVIAGRPYDKPHDLVTRHIVPPSDYNKIADRLTTKK